MGTEPLVGAEHPSRRDPVDQAPTASIPPEHPELSAASAAAIRWLDGISSRAAVRRAVASLGPATEVRQGELGAPAVQDSAGPSRRAPGRVGRGSLSSMNIE